MSQDSIDRIRSATFTVARKGYEKREVDRYLTQLADWLEAGGMDDTLADSVRRELERVGQKTGGILTGAHDAGEQLRAEAADEADKVLRAARAAADEQTAAADKHSRETRDAADRYSREARDAADEYSAATRAKAEQYAEATRTKAEQGAGAARAKAQRDAKQTVGTADAEAKRIVAEGEQRRRDIETVIGDLEDRRDAVLADLERLGSQLGAAVGQHRPAGGDASQRAAADQPAAKRPTGAAKRPAEAKSPKPEGRAPTR